MADRASVPSTRGTGPSPRQAALAAFSGSFMEWYDFYLFGTASALIFPKLFFPESAPLAGTLAAFGAFAAGFITRPIGALIFGHYGDRIGRKPMLILTVGIMGICTGLIGLLPTFGSIGVWSAVLLVALRLIQGLGIGGEFGAGALVAMENAPVGKRGLMGSFHQMGTPTGLLVSTGVFALARLASDEAFYKWVWRVPFLLSFAFLVVALYIRKRLPETATFATDPQATRQRPLVSLIKEHPKNLLLAVGARMADAVTFNVINTFGIAYATRTLGLSGQVMLTGFVIAAVVEMVTVPLIGRISDRVGRRPVYLTGIAICGLFGIAYFPLLATGQTLLIWLAIVVMLAFGTGCMFAIQGTLFAELFGTRVRYTGVGVAYQASALIGGAPTPLVATALVAWASGSYWPVVGLLFAICALSALCIVLASETYKSSLVEQPDQTLPVA